VEQDNVYNQLAPLTFPSGVGAAPGLPADLFSFNTVAGAWAYNTPPYDLSNPANYPPGMPNHTGIPSVANTVIKSFLCPSDNAQDVTIPPILDSAGNMGGVIDGLLIGSAPVRVGGFAANTTVLWYDYVWDWPRFGHELGAANYVGNAGFFGADMKVGTNNPMGTGPYYQNSKTKVSDISDGTSNTIAFGETLGGRARGVRDSRLSWMGAGSLPSVYGSPAPSGMFYYSFGSKHPGVTNFALCDGSVRTIIQGINPCSGVFGNYNRVTNCEANYQAFIALSGMHDGLVVDLSQLGN
jgi:prepilin-type processing-associated H-X9-DG protein